MNHGSDRGNMGWCRTAAPAHDAHPQTEERACVSGHLVRSRVVDHLPANRVWDPGVGFGKTHQHNLILLSRCSRYHDLGCPLLVGHSRKGFIGEVLGDGEADRVAGTIGVALSLARQGVQVIRVHDVAQVRQALVLFDATGGIDGRHWTRRGKPGT